MITVCEEGKCTGCMECTEICPKGAIQVVDSMIEYDAIIDSNKCINCNACHKACQNNNELMLTKPLSSNRCCECNWRFEINKWKTISCDFTTKILILYNLKFASFEYRTIAGC